MQSQTSEANNNIKFKKKTTLLEPASPTNQSVCNSQGFFIACSEMKFQSENDTPRKGGKILPMTTVNSSIGFQRPKFNLEEDRVPEQAKTPKSDDG